MAKAFQRFTQRQQKAIRRTLKAANLIKSDNDHWQQRILPDITTVLTDLCEGNAHPDSLMYPGEVKKRFAALTKAYDQLGERLQWTLDDRLGCRLPEVLADLCNPAEHSNNDEELKKLDALGFQLPEALKLPPTSHLYVQSGGRPKDRVIRLMVTKLLEIFERETGVNPTVFPYPLLKRATKTPKSGVEYHGTFYPFALACLAPVFPAQELGSAILTAYNEVNRTIDIPPKRAKRIK